MRVIVAINRKFELIFSRACGLSKRAASGFCGTHSSCERPHLPTYAGDSFTSLRVAYSEAGDWSQTFFYWVPNSGFPPSHNLFDVTLNGSQWLTGGTVGPEAGDLSARLGHCGDIVQLETSGSAISGMRLFG